MPREVDLSKPIEMQELSIADKDDGGVKLSVETEMSNYPMPLFINAEQKKALNGTGKYKALLVPSKLKDGKDGIYQSHYWYNAYSFEDIYDERNKPKGDAAPPTPRKDTAFKDAFDLIDAPFKQPVGGASNNKPEYGTQPYWINNSVIFKFASDNCTGDTEEEIVASLNRLFKQGEKVYYKEYKELSLVEQAQDIGAKIVDIKPVEHNLFDEDIYDYPRPPMDVDSQGFYEYCEKAGWGKETVKDWLGNSTVEGWVEGTPGLTYRDVLVECRKKALEERVYAPDDFRGEPL